MAEDQHFGDHILLKAFSLKFGMRITILKAPTLTEERFRHEHRMSIVDIVLVYNGYQHYSGTGKELFLY